MSGARTVAERGQHASLTGTGRSEVHEPGIEVVPVKRYRPGKAPDWLREQEGLSAAGSNLQLPAPPHKPAEDSRPRVRHEAQIVATSRPDASAKRPSRDDEEDDDDEEEDEIEARRARARAKMRQQEAAASAAAGGAGPAGAAAADDGVGEEEEESEYETDSGEDDDDDDDDDTGGGGGRVLLKPVFVSKTARATVRERELEEAAAEEEEKRKIERLAERRKETLDLVVQTVRLEDEAESAKLELDPALPDDDDEADELEEYEAWKVRELRRVKAERDRRVAAENERRELERRRNLTEEERAREDAERLAAQHDKKDGAVERRFLQKYYHKGAFYQGDDEKGDPLLGDVMRRDFGEATGNDRIGNKASLPAVMQVKKFGFRSQVKWTHLSAEDTTEKEAIFAARDRQPGAYVPGPPRAGLAGRRTGGDDFSRPSGKRARR